MCLDATFKIYLTSKSFDKQHYDFLFCVSYAHSFHDKNECRFLNRLHVVVNNGSCFFDKKCIIVLSSSFN